MIYLRKGSKAAGLIETGLHDPSEIHTNTTGRMVLSGRSLKLVGEVFQERFGPSIGFEGVFQRVSVGERLLDSSV